jgi:hypothetical protein
LVRWALFPELPGVETRRNTKMLEMATLLWYLNPGGGIKRKPNERGMNRS